ncbi:hypothetical protein Tcan_00574, partial [Toxocara canis]
MCIFPSNKPGNCCLKDVVDSIQCRACDAKYIDRTSRLLRERPRQHFLNMASPLARSYTTHPMVIHTVECPNLQAVNIVVEYFFETKTHLFGKLKSPVSHTQVNQRPTAASNFCP